MKKMTRLMAMLLSLLVLFQSAALADGTTAVSSDAVTEELYQGWVETATTYAAEEDISTAASSTAVSNTADTVGETVQQGRSTTRVMKSGYEYKIYDAAGNLVTTNITITETTDGIRIAASSSATIGNYTVVYGTTTDGTFTQEGSFPLKVVEQDTYTGSYSLSQSNYGSSDLLYWDQMTITFDESGNVTSKQKDSTENIASVTLNGKTVATANSSGTTWENGSALSYYYGSDLTSNSTVASETLVITPDEGYYVTYVVVACASSGGSNQGGQGGHGGQGGGTQTPYNCNTWGNGQAFTKSFEISTSGSVSIDLPSYSFGHGNNNANAYFILIAVAAIPSPLYVEYDYGTIGTLLTDAGYTLSNTEFGNADAWTDDNTDANKLGTGTIHTNDTQFMYAYADGLSEEQKAEAVKNWAHTSNTVTDGAKETAAEIGYYFAGWYAEYFNEDKVTKNAEGSYNNYTYELSDSYGSGSYGENETVALTTNVRLTAQWKPVELKVTKTVAGMTDTFVGTAHSYIIQVEKQDSNGNWSLYNNAELTFTMSDNGTSAIQTVSPIVPGTYRVVETNNGGDLKSGSTVLYVSVKADGTATYSNAGIVDGKTRTATLNVTNSYSEISYTTVDITKTVSGNMGDRSKAFDVTIHVKHGDTDYSGYAVNGVTTNNAAVSMTFKHNDTIKLTNVPIGATVTVTENAAGYTATDTVTGGVDSTAAENIATVTLTGATTIAFENNKSETVDTGILLDSLPYVLILVLVGGGVVLWLANRRRRRED